MNEVPDTELFSAYLDGELTAEEQVRVEQVLAASPEARQLLEELRALENTLQGLPQVKLDEDLSVRVLEVAERRMLLPERSAGDPAAEDARPAAGRAAAASVPPEADSIGWLGVPWREISWRGMFSKRALIWSAIVVTTAIIIGYNSPNSNHELARNDKLPAPGPSAVSSHGQDGRSSDAVMRSLTSQPQKPPTSEMVAKGDDSSGSSLRKLAASGLASKKRPSKGTDAERARANGKDRDASNSPQVQLAWRGGEEVQATLAGKGSAGGSLKDLPVGGDSAPTQPASSADKARLVDDSKKAAPAGALADTKQETPAKSMPAQAVVATAPAALAPNPAGHAQGDAAKPAAEPTSPTVAMSPPRASFTKPSATKRGGAYDAADAQRNLGGDKSGPRGSNSAEADTPQNRTAGANNTNAGQQVVNGMGAVAMNSSAATDAAGGKRSVEQVPANQFAGQRTAGTTLVRLDVTTQAARDKVFEGLLTQNGLHGGQNSTPSSKPIRYELDASREQIENIMTQIDKRADSFFRPKFAQNYNFAGNAYSGGGAGQGLESRRGAQQAKAGASEGASAPWKMAMSEASTAAAPGSASQNVAPPVGSTKMHVVFVLNVVDRLPPAVVPDSQAPPPAASSAKQQP